MTAPRPVEVAPERIAGWVARFTTSHGEVTWSLADAEGQGGSPSAYLLSAADGSWARLQGWASPSGADRPPDLSAAAAWVRPPGPVLTLLVRRGGYAVAVSSGGGELLASKVGTRHVQSRTAAGGWSQQRFARRRANQADELVGALVGHAVRVLQEGEGRAGPVAALVVGGDPSLTAQALAGLGHGPRRRVPDLPRRELPDLADPRRSVLEEAVRRGRAVRVRVHNAEGRGAVPGKGAAPRP
ncbi:acVLRF1 family peptidyl-tRNA hydrolase [Ornithinimicrobium flavum]|uniref:acVLRF1 family peptidyl-tRNA hydrolase n=1 Tax=Ornithinimicrobium flavum TaxID=1288636 RepID=UPI001070268D|nr:acVLRF1 family peptidyl-tRNA hydrolase [Ornithinimicrobium flavum]